MMMTTTTMNSNSSADQLLKHHDGAKAAEELWLCHLRGKPAEHLSGEREETEAEAKTRDSTATEGIRLASAQEKKTAKKQHYLQ